MKLMGIKSGVVGVACAMVVSLAVAGSASAQFLQVTIEEIDLGAPAGFVTYRVVAHFAGPDIMLAWGAIPPADLHFFTGNGVNLLNAGGPFSGFKDEDFALFPISEAYDSWVTVGSTELIGNETNYVPGFIGSNGVNAAILGNAFDETDGLVFDDDPTSPVVGPDIVIAQFTIPGVPGGLPGDPGHNGFHLEGVVAWTPPGAGPDFEVSPFVVDNIVGCQTNEECNDAFPCNGEEVCAAGVCLPSPPDPDCNGNGQLDSCDIADGTSPDCNTNGIPDDCDIGKGGTSLDFNNDGIPDDCQCISDINNDGIVGINDFLKVLYDWGTCP